MDADGRGLDAPPAPQYEFNEQAGSLNFLAKLLTYMDKVLVGGASAFWMSHGSKLAPSRDSPLASASSWPAVCLVFLDRALATSGRTHRAAATPLLFFESPESGSDPLSLRSKATMRGTNCFRHS